MSPPLYAPTQIVCVPKSLLRPCSRFRDVCFEFASHEVVDGLSDQPMLIVSSCGTNKHASEQCISTETNEEQNLTDTCLYLREKWWARQPSTTQTVPVSRVDVWVHHGF